MFMNSHSQASQTLILDRPDADMRLSAAGMDYIPPKKVMDYIPPC